MSLDFIFGGIYVIFVVLHIFYFLMPISLYSKVLAERARRYFPFFWCETAAVPQIWQTSGWLGNPTIKKYKLRIYMFQTRYAILHVSIPQGDTQLPFSPCPLLFCRYFLLSPSYSLAFNLLSPPLKQMHQILWFANFIVFSRFISLTLHAVFWRRSYPICM